MFRQPALAASAFAGLHDELLAYLTLFCDTTELLALARVNSVFYVFAREEPLWMLHCLRLHGGEFTFDGSWRVTTFFPRAEARPKAMPARFPPLHVRDFGSDFLYRRWCRSHMSLRDFVPPHAHGNAYARTIKRLDVCALSRREFYEQYALIPFILTNAIAQWPASTEWTLDKLAARFADPIVRHRLTHNLDTASDKANEMGFGDYQQYIAQQQDETPLYIFDPRFGEKMPSMLADYRVADLKIFDEDLLKTVAEQSQLAEAEANALKNNGHPSSNAIGNGNGNRNANANANANANGSTAKAKKPPKAIRPDFRWIVIGPERSGAPWHTDPARTSAWNALVHGRKRWALYPPESPPPGVAVGKNADTGREHAMNMTSLAWYLHVYPTLQPHERPIEIVQEPGDVIYVPSGWWHLVLNLEETVAVTQNFVDSHNLVAFVKDLLDDQQDGALRTFQHTLQRVRPETYDICRLVTIPRMHGYLNFDLYMSSFRNTDHWKGNIKSVCARHKLGYAELRQRSGGSLRCLTARVNPTFALGNAYLIKFFSELNQDWGEFDFAAYLAASFAEEQQSINGSDDTRVAKKRKTGILQPHELKSAMTLRYAMEECFRNKRDTYALIAAAVQADPSAYTSGLAEMVPKLFHASHMLDVSDVDDEDGEGLLWRWPYAVMEFKTGLTGLAKLVKRGGATRASWARLADWLGREFVPRFHAVPIARELTGLFGHAKASWDWYAHYLLLRRKGVLAFHLKEDAIPPQLMNDLEAFLPAVSADAIASLMLPPWASKHAPVLLHGDLTDENVLGVRTSSRRRISDNAPALSCISQQHAPTEDIATLLRSVGCDKYIPLLVEQQEMTLATLSMVTERHLQELGLPLGPRLAILRAVETLGNNAGGGARENGHAIAWRQTASDRWEAASDVSGSSDEESDDEDDVNEFVLPPDALVALRSTRLDKFVGPHEWVPSQVIDFADAKTGDPLYDLVAIFFAALHCDRELWVTTLASPYWQEYLRREGHQRGDAQGQQLRERFLRLVLLHPSRSIKSLLHFFPETLRLMTWRDVAAAVFGDIFVPTPQ